MADEKVVSIEDRIPKLKEARRKKTNRRLVFYICLFFILISIVVYIQSPLSYIKAIDVIGNQYLTEEQILEYSELSKQVNIWSFQVADIEANLEVAPEIKSASVNRRLPNKIEIEIEEHEKIGYISEGEFLAPLLESGTILSSFRISEYNGDAPLLINFTDQEYLMMLVNQLRALPETIAAHISEIYWEPTEANPFSLRLFMNDGYVVLVSIRDFSAHMSSYPSIVSQLDEDSGTIEIGMGGAIFSSNNQDDEELDEENEEEKIEDEA